ncbi:MAG: STAS domain-containing protein [Gaiella sp.]|nr:STAS domain-containing protein [Gaiella sp.]
MSDDGTVFDIASSQADGIAIVAVTGEIDLTNADAFQEAVDGTTAPAVVLDLAGVTYLDSSAIRAIDRSRRRFRSEKRSFFIVSPPDTPSSWTFRVSGFDCELVVDSVEAALAAVGRDAPPR